MAIMSVASKLNFSNLSRMYFTETGVKRDHDGYYRSLGRVDESLMLNVSFFSQVTEWETAEVENAINEHPLVIESAVVGYPHESKVQGIYAYVICDMTKQNRGLSRSMRSKKKMRSKDELPNRKPDKISKS